MQKTLNKILQEPAWSFVSIWNLKSLTLFCLFSFVFIRCHTSIHSLSLVAILCYLLSLVVFVGTLCTTCGHSLLFVVTRSTTRCHCHLLPLNVPVVCLFINDRFFIYWIKHLWKFHIYVVLPVFRFHFDFPFYIFTLLLGRCEAYQIYSWENLINMTSSKYELLKIKHYSQENTCLGVFL